MGLGIRNIVGVTFFTLFIYCSTALAQQADPQEDVYVWDPKKRQLYHGLLPRHEDPIESFNRSSLRLNDWFRKNAISPVARVYRVITPRPVRSGIRNFGDNLRTPVSVVNNLLQLNSLGTINEFGRFVINTTLGIGGLFRADRWIGMEENREDFGQTLAVWGLPPGPFLMRPLLGPSTVTDTVGDLVDIPLNPANWVGLPIWSRVIVFFNDSFMTIRDYELASGDSLEAFKYDLIRSAYYAQRQAAIQKRAPLYGQKPDLQKLASPLHQSITYALLSPEDEDFVDESVVVPLMIDHRRGHTEYRFWRNTSTKSLVVLVPGTGGSIYDGSLHHMAESFYEKGHSVALVDSPFYWGSVKSYIGFTAANGQALPGVMADDVRDFAHLLNKVLYDVSHRQMHKKGAKGKSRTADQPYHFTQRSLVGVSLGGLVAMHMASTLDRHLQQPLFNRYIALNPPLELRDSIRRVDNFYDSFFDPKKSAANERLEQFANKIGQLQIEKSLAALTQLNDEEAAFAIGYAFHLTVASVIYQSQEIMDQGVLLTAPDAAVADRLKEIFNLSFTDYFEKFVFPARRVSLNDPSYDWEDFSLESDYSAIAEKVAADSRILIIHSENDPFVSPASLQKLKSSLPEKRLKVFAQGGHLGAFTKTEALDLLNDMLAEGQGLR